MCNYYVRPLKKIFNSKVKQCIEIELRSMVEQFLKL